MNVQSVGVSSASVRPLVVANALLSLVVRPIHRRPCYAESTACKVRASLLSCLHRLMHHLQNEKKKNLSFFWHFFGQFSIRFFTYSFWNYILHRYFRLRNKENVWVCKALYYIIRDRETEQKFYPSIGKGNDLKLWAAHI